MKKNIIIITILWIIITISILVFNESILKLGKIVSLEVYPADPRDFLRGDYVTLEYRISTIPSYSRFYKSRDYRDVYVTLSKLNDNNEVYRIENIQTIKPKNKLFIKGELKQGKIHYPSIEKYFLKENTGRELEKQLAKGAIAKVSINQNGEARIKEIIISDKINN